MPTMTNVHRSQSFQQGDTWQIQGNLSYADGSPFDLNTGAFVEWGLQDSAGATVIVLTLGAGIEVIDPNAGTLLITMTPLQSSGIAVGDYADQLRAIDPLGYVSTQWYGPINVYASFFN
jgi:hypothetical protein